MKKSILTTDVYLTMSIYSFLSLLFSQNVMNTTDHNGCTNYFWNLMMFFLISSRAVLEMQMSDGLHEMGYPKWQLVVCLFLVYTMLYLSLFKGVKSSGNSRK